MIKRSLGVRLRLDLRNVLPIEGTLKEMNLVRALHKKLEFNEDEIATWRIEQVGKQVTWNEEASREVEFKFSPEEASFIAKQLEKLSVSGKITLQNISLCDMFLEEN